MTAPLVRMFGVALMLTALALPFGHTPCRQVCSLHRGLDDDFRGADRHTGSVISQRRRKIGA